MKTQCNQQLADWPNPTEKSLWVFRLQEPDEALWEQHKALICQLGGFWAAEESSPIRLAASHALIGSGKLGNLHWRYVERLIESELAQLPTEDDRSAVRDAALRYRLSLGAALPGPLVRQLRNTWPQVSIAEPWNTTPDSRWCRAREAEALRYYSNDLVIDAQTEAAKAKATAKLEAMEKAIASHDVHSLHRIAKAQTTKDGPNMLLWAQRADAAAAAAGIGSRHNLDNDRIAAREAKRTASEARGVARRQNAAIRKMRQRAAQAAREGDAARAQYLRQQAADLRRMTIDPETGDTTMTHQPPARPGRGGPRANAGGRRPGTGGARPGAGRKPLFAPAPPEPSADSVAHADKDVSAARRWSAHAAYLAKHFTYVAATGELIGPSGKALDLRHPVSTPVGALRPGLLIAALLHGTVTRRYALPRGSEAASRWPLHTLTVSVVDRERDTGPAQPGTPAHLLVPPSPRLRGLALELRP